VSGSPLVPCAPRFRLQPQGSPCTGDNGPV